MACNPTAHNWQRIGDVSLHVLKQELARVSSPMLNDIEATYNAARPHSALFFAQAWMENKYETTGHIIRPEHHNPVSLRPERIGHLGPYASDLITAPDGGQFLAFRRDAECVREWKRRLIDEADTYKGGVYAGKETLDAMLAVYAPSGDVHPITGVDNADINYASTVRAMLNRYAELEGTMNSNDVVVGIGKGESPHGSMALNPSTATVPADVMPHLEMAPAGQLTVRYETDVFFRVNRKMVAVRETPRYQQAILGGPVAGPPLQSGEEAYIEWAWITVSGELWLLSQWNTRFFGADFSLDTGEPLQIPDPGPAVPLDLTPPVVNPGEPAFMSVADPRTLLPPITWVGSPNFFPGRGGFGNPIAMVDHITDDMNVSNVLNWFMNPSSQASSHFVIDRNGKVYQCVSSLDGAWTNGDVNQTRQDIPWLRDLINRGVNVNNATISIEHIGTPSNPPTDAQYEASRKIHMYFSHPKVYGINRDRSHQLRHGDINAVDRSYCPGPHFDLKGTIEMLGGDPARMDS